MRDACDLGQLVTLVTDACPSIIAGRHETSRRTLRGSFRQGTTDALLQEIGQG